MKDSKELAAISAVISILSNDAQCAVFVQRPVPNIPSPWQAWGARQTMQHRNTIQSRIIKRVR